MISTLKAMVWRAVRTARVDERVVATAVPALARNGWIRSRRDGRCVDAAGKPIPWITYPAIEFLARRVRPEMTVFEYGSGASTMWWASRVKQVVAVEHDLDWFERVRSLLPPNATIVHAPLGGDGKYAANVHEHGVQFDVIVIDGRDRVRCVRHAVRAVGPNGVIVFDNSDRTAYAEGYRVLADEGFRKIEFVGMAPMIDHESETAVYYRSENAFGM